MKRIGLLGSLALALSVCAVGCDYNIPVDDAGENPAVPGPRGIIRGSVTYYGPSPCFRNGEVEGQVVILLFDAANPPPPDGLASTALNFATVAGAKLFSNVAPPPAKTPGGVGNNASFCPSVDSAPITAATDWSMQQIGAGRYQVRAFYSRQSRWNPLFNFANLALAGDVPGGALVDAREALPRFATVEVGTPIKSGPNAGKLEIGETGFLREGVPITLGNPLRFNRPYFHIDIGASLGYDVPPVIGADFADNYVGQRKQLTPDELRARGYITFPQDHLSTSRSKGFDSMLGSCVANPNPNCDLFEYAQPSFPQIRFKYGFAGAADDIGNPEGPDAWIARNALPAQAFSTTRRKFYGIDPKEFEGDIPTSGKFALTRVFDKNGKPEILRDNDTLETVAQIAEIFPNVVLSKLVDDGEGKLALPPRSQTDPIVVIQTITLKDWESGPKVGQPSMKATSESAVVAGELTNKTPLTKPDGTTANPGTVPDPNHPLASRSGVVLQDGFTALVRPSVVCIYPQDDLRGTLVTPVQKDPNPDNAGADLVVPSKILALRANRVKNLSFGCLPPGYYSVNVVYPTGQAWSFPNLTGHCSFTARSSLPGEVPTQNEDCYMPNKNVAAGGFNWLDPRTLVRGFDPNRGFPLRPLLRSQSPFQYEDDGKLKFGPIPGGPAGDTRTITLPQVVVITPSPRCGRWESETAVSCANDAACPAPFKGACIAGKCDVNGDGKISKQPIWLNNPENEDTSLDTPMGVSALSANGRLDMGEDKNMNGKLDMHVPFTCALPRDRWATLPEEKLLK